ncbi:glycosyltransferase family 4 protein [Acuticoccus mangrovi]|uniref:Glycosyltransferase family 4 protein n=1 Tax=Acuticoccus mangrovi TaxID=2796142 RepID=A0A934IPA8_9HYPH|nr:glycosyltransferase family 4 protein [Acuticoccus mangrovi]MBJ3776166.1 glycosyltransferase family 4 protein [Acuticoccus mangrovi]
MRPITFAYPGDLDTLTGGYGYDRRLIEALKAAGHTVTPLALGDGFPDPDGPTLDGALSRLAAVPATTTLLVDGLAYGALPAEGLERVAAPIVAVVHHPLALETGVAPDAAPAIAARERAALTHARAVVVTSRHTRDTLVADYGVAADAIHVAVPGLDGAWHQSTARRPARPPRIVSVASIVPRKGFDILVAALAKVSDLAWNATIIGSLDRAPDAVVALANQIAAAGLGRRIAFIGEAGQAEIRAVYREASLFALASRYEGFGMVFAEAMASGLPIVATRGGAIPDVVPETAGILVDVDAADAFAAALRTVLTGPALSERLSAGAAAAAKTFDGWEETGAIVSRLVQELQG